MQARIRLAIHSLEQLDGVQIADLTQLVIATFGVVQEIADNDMVVRFTSGDHVETIKWIEALQPQLARRFGSLLWLSVASEEISREAS